MAVATRNRPRSDPATTRPGRSRDLALFPKQLDAVAATQRYVALVGGLGSGKTHTGAVKVISRLHRKEVGIVAAPTYPTLRDATQRTLFGLLGDLGIPYEHNKSERLVTFESGHEIMLRSLDDPDNVRGPNVAYAWVDEAAFVKYKSIQVIKARVRIGNMQQVWYTTTPRGKNWLFEEFVKHPTPRHKMFRMSTLENTTLDADYAESLGYTGTYYDQEILGQFVAFEGLVYGGFNRETMVRETGEGIDLEGNPRVNVDGWRILQGGDVGTRNPTVVLTGHLASDGRLHISREFYQRNLGATGILEAFSDEAGIAEPESVYIDPSAAAYIDDLIAEGVPVEKANNDISTGIQRVSSCIAEGFTVDPSCVHLIDELESYHYPDEDRSRRIDSDKPVKQNDHCVDALRYMVMGAGDEPLDLEEFFKWQR